MSSPNSRDFYDAELRTHHEPLRDAYGIFAGDEVVDIGCGTGADDSAPHAGGAHGSFSVSIRRWESYVPAARLDGQLVAKPVEPRGRLPRWR